MQRQTHKRLGDLLLDNNMITKEQLLKALETQNQTGMKFGEVLVSLGYVTEQDIIELLEFQLGIPHVKLEKINIDKDAALLVSENLARRYGLIPIRKEKGMLTVAMSDPLNVYAIDDVKIYTGMEVQPLIATVKEVNKAIDKFFGTKKALDAVEEFKKEQESSIKIYARAEEEQSFDEVSNAPAVKLVNSIIEQAVRSRASDIHIEPFENHIIIRFRIDGQLYEVMRPEIGIMPAISARIKIIGGMNIAEKRLPQDGRFNAEVDNRAFDLRVSILPTVFGEKIVIRIADPASFIVSKSKLGMNEKDQKSFSDMLKNPHGIILVTGPTGSGKTVTLYSAINELNKPNVNIITIEDPVEALIEGVNQVQVNYKTGLTFALGLRSILRQDPDVIMLGEIRDSETAEIAVKAAITGHLVLSTLHTNDAPSSVIRLIDMGIEPFMVASAITGVISQRLVRVICNECKYKKAATPEQLKALGSEYDHAEIYYGKGCPVCNGTGYKGRVGVYEIMTITSKHRELINKGCSTDELMALCIENGMTTLKENVTKLVLSGVTSLEEMLRIAYSNE